MVKVVATEVGIPLVDFTSKTHRPIRDRDIKVPPPKSKTATFDRISFVRP